MTGMLAHQYWILVAAPSRIFSSPALTSRRNRPLAGRRSRRAGNADLARARGHGRPDNEIAAALLMGADLTAERGPDPRPRRRAAAASVATQLAVARVGEDEAGRLLATSRGPVGEDGMARRARHDRADPESPIPTPPSGGRRCVISPMRRPRSSRRSARGWPPRGGAPGCWPCRAKTASGREARSSPAAGGTGPPDPAEHEGQPWTATEPTLALLRDFGVDPQRRARATGRGAGQRPLPLGARRPAVLRRRGRAVHQRQDRRARRLLRSGRRGHRRPPAGRAARGRRVELRGGARLRALVVRHHDQRPGRAAGARARNRRLGGIHRGATPGRGVPPRTEACSGARARARSSTRPGCSSRFRPAGTTTCCAPWSTSERPAIRRTRGWTKRWRCSDPSSSPMARGCWRTRIPARSISRSRTATVGPAGGTRCGRCVSSTAHPVGAPPPGSSGAVVPSSA